MFQQLADGDLGLPLIDFGLSHEQRLIVDELMHRIIELQLALFDQLQNRDGSNRLRDAGNPKQTLRRNRLARADIGKTEAAGINQLAVARNGDCTSRDRMLVEEGRKQAIEGGDFLWRVL